MEAVEPGHLYHLFNMEGRFPPQTLEFIKKEDGLMIHDGTTNEEVVEVLIDRMTFLDQKLPCRDNGMIISALNMALGHMRDRRKKRLAQKVLGTDKPHIEGGQ